ncbi:cytochrome P450 [Pholiota conissans]|uniref:Cytochrome P450 n=1 Tax=Pholiota conissans TaxID=109636 RepID=A0A9P5Z5M7_9AGAR|nr:cytochrome P450 [Pholiota conissans]
MVVVTPGVDLLAKGFFLLAASIGVLSSSLSYLTSKAGYDVPTWLLLVLCAGSVPIITSIYVIGDKLLKWRAAQRIGARMVPEVQGKYPGNLDVLQIMIKNLEDGYPGDGLDELLEKHGQVVNMRVAWSDLIMTTSPEHIKTILATDFQNYVKGPRFQSNMGAVLGTGVFNSDGDMWKFHRSITRPMFTRERISHFDLFDRRAQQAIDKLRERLREGYAIDFQDLMSRFTLDAATEFLFGNCVESLSAGLPYPHNAPYIPLVRRTPKGDAANAFARAFLESQEIISFRERSGWVWPLGEITRDKTYAPMQVVNSYIEPIVKEALRKKRQSPKAMEAAIEADDATLLDHLVNVTDDPVVLKDEILNIMIAGRDTTAATLTFIFYFLAIYPDVCARLREEIISKVGSTRRPDYDDVRDMKYLRAVINETLRLYPIVPFNIRESIHDTTWAAVDPTEKPYFIPAGTKTAYSVFMMHRRKDLWGPDAEEFDPDRFLDERLKKYVSKNPFIFLPFNAGPRICLGQQFAYNEMSFMIIRLLQSFSSVELAPASAPPEAQPPAEWAQATGRKAIERLFPKMHLTMYSNGGLWVKMTEGDAVN